MFEGYSPSMFLKEKFIDESLLINKIYKTNEYGIIIRY